MEPRLDNSINYNFHLYDGSMNVLFYKQAEEILILFKKSMTHSKGKCMKQDPLEQSGFFLYLLRANFFGYVNVAPLFLE